MKCSVRRGGGKQSAEDTHEQQVKQMLKTLHDLGNSIDKYPKWVALLESTGPTSVMIEALRRIDKYFIPRREETYKQRISHNLAGAYPMDVFVKHYDRMWLDLEHVKAWLQRNHRSYFRPFGRKLVVSPETIEFWARVSKIDDGFRNQSNGVHALFLRTYEDSVCDLKNFYELYQYVRFPFNDLLLTVNIIEALMSNKVIIANRPSFGRRPILEDSVFDNLPNLSPQMIHFLMYNFMSTQDIREWMETTQQFPLNLLAYVARFTNYRKYIKMFFDRYKHNLDALKVFWSYTKPGGITYNRIREFGGITPELVLAYKEVHGVNTIITQFSDSEEMISAFLPTLTTEEKAIIRDVTRPIPIFSIPFVKRLVTENVINPSNVLWNKVFLTDIVNYKSDVLQGDPNIQWALQQIRDITSLYDELLTFPIHYLEKDLLALWLLTGTVYPLRLSNIMNSIFNNLETPVRDPELWSNYIRALQQAGHIIPLGLFSKWAKQVPHVFCKNKDKHTFMGTPLNDIAPQKLFVARGYCYDIGELEAWFENVGIKNENPNTDAETPELYNEDEFKELLAKSQKIRELYYSASNKEFLEILQTPAVTNFIVAVGDTAATIYRYHRLHTSTVDHREGRVTNAMIKLMNKWLEIPLGHREKIQIAAPDIKNVILNLEKCDKGLQCTALLRSDLFRVYIRWIDLINRQRLAKNLQPVEPSKRLSLFISSNQPNLVKPYILDTLANNDLGAKIEENIIPSSWIPTNQPDTSGKCKYYDRKCPEVDVPGNKSWCDTEHYNLIRLGQGRARRCYYLPNVIEDINTAKSSNAVKIQLRPHQYEPHSGELIKIGLQIRDVMSKYDTSLTVKAQSAFEYLDQSLRSNGRTIFHSFG